MKQEKIIGCLLIAGALGVLIPYTILTITFNYPEVLRQEPGMILKAFHEGGAGLIYTWLAFALLGLPLLIAYSLIGQLLENKLPYVRWATSIGIISGIVQIIGLLRWVFVVPILATEFVQTDTVGTKDAILVSFKLVHQFGGVLLGEHLGQLFTIIWTMVIAYALLKLKFIAKPVAWLGFISAAIYLLAQTELLATVIPGFPVISIAGFVGSTLWLIWLLVIGFRFLTLKKVILN